MQDRQIRETQFRQAAADCLELAKAATDPIIRAALVTMAQGWHDLAEGPFDETFRQLPEDFNERQIMKPPAAQPVSQQEQQIRPKEE